MMNLFEKGCCVASGLLLWLATEAFGAGERTQYVLAMSGDDSICKPLLAEYNRNIDLDIGGKNHPYPYPWPAPRALSLKWTMKDWQGLSADQRTLEKAYTVTEGDVNADKQSELIVRFAIWHRADDRFSSLTVFPKGTELPKRMDEYKSLPQYALATVVPGRYQFPKLIPSPTPTELNDFDVIHFRGHDFVTGKTVVMDGVRELDDVPKWRVISRVRLGHLGAAPVMELDRVLDSVCYFQLN